jgi:hypothetical protein
MHARMHSLMCCVGKYICQPYDDATGTKLISSIMKSYCGVLHGVLVLCVCERERDTVIQYGDNFVRCRMECRGFSLCDMVYAWFIY